MTPGAVASTALGRGATVTTSASVAVTGRAVAGIVSRHFDIVSRLVEDGFLVKNPERGIYALSLCTLVEMGVAAYV